MAYTPSPRPGNLQRAEWRNKYRQALSDYINILNSNFIDYSLANEAIKKKLRKNINLINIYL